MLIDIILIVIILFGAFWGYKKGLINEVFRNYWNIFSDIFSIDYV